MTTTSLKNSFVPPGLVNNLQEVLLNRKGKDGEQAEKGSGESGEPSVSTPPPGTVGPDSEPESSKPVVLVTNGDGIDSPGLTHLVEALVREGMYNVHVCAPESDKSVSGHSISLRETVAVSTAEMNGATAYEVCGTPVDCVSLALSGALFSWSKPSMVISGINKGASCGHHAFYSGAVAGAREALSCGVPSMSLSLNWKKEESQESNFKDAVSVCLPLIKAALRDIEKGVFPKSFLLNIDIPSSPSTSKGFKLTKQSLWKSTPCWQASASRRLGTAPFMSNQQSLGLQLAQLGRDASAAGAARRLSTQRNNVEIESVGVAGKSVSGRAVKRYFRLEFLERDQEGVDEDLDFRALENGFVAITPLSLLPRVESGAQEAVSNWVLNALDGEQ